MKTRAVWLLLGIGLGAAVGTACEIDNPDHCANQDQDGNAFCAALNSATPFCSPCHAKNQGCLPFEPLSCEAYMGGGDTGMTGGMGGMTGMTTAGPG